MTTRPFLGRGNRIDFDDAPVSARDVRVASELSRASEMAARVAQIRSSPHVLISLKVLYSFIRPPP